MKITDTFIIDATPKKTENGFMVANVRAVRTGIQQYMGAELGRPDLGVVNVYRPESEVFHKDSINSFAGITLTSNHPDEQVTADNWKDYAVGDVVVNDVLREGQFMRLNIIVRDGNTIKDVEAGRNIELSAGYDAELEWVDGITDDGLTYQAIQKNIRANHLSFVSNARGGKQLKIGDNAMATKNMIVDGLLVEVTDAAEAAVNKLTKDRDAAVAVVATKDSEIASLTKQVETLTGEKAVLEQKVKDSALTPEALNAAVAERAKVVDAAKKIVPTFDAGVKTDAEIKREVVKSRIGDTATSMSDDAISGAFSLLSVSDTTNPNVRDSLGNVDHSKVVNIADAQKRADDAHAAMVAGYARKAD